MQMKGFIRLFGTAPFHAIAQYQETPPVVVALRRKRMARGVENKLLERQEKIIPLVWDFCIAPTNFFSSTAGMETGASATNRRVYVE